MPTLYRDTGYSLHHLVENIQMGLIALPDIQRPFVWRSSKVRDLFDSMYRGYPVGTLLLWETGAEVGTRQVGGGDAIRVPRLLIVDGQQRLTSLFAVMTGTEILTSSFERKRIKIAFRPLDQTFEVADAAIQRDADFIPDITALWAEGYKSTVRKYFKRLKESTGQAMPHGEQDALEERIDRVRDLRDFRFQVIELGMDADEPEVAEIFVRINSEGVKLNQADFILTLMSVHWEEGRRDLERFCRSAVDRSVTGPAARNAYLNPGPDQMLRAAVGLAFRRGRLQHVYSILRGKDLETGRFSEDNRINQFASLAAAQQHVLDLTNWHEFLKVLAHAGFRSGKMITSENAVIYTYLLWLIGKYDYHLGYRELRAVMGRWFFMVHTTGRYTSSPETAIEADLARLRAIALGDGEGFIKELDRLVSANFTGDYWDITLPTRLDTSSSRSPALFAYWAALNVLDAELLFSTQRMRDMYDTAGAAPRAIERHHLFPKALLAARGLTDTSSINAIANMAFLDWPDNAAIGAQDPTVYWPKFQATLTPEKAKGQMYLHALPVGWEQLEYEEFLKRRQVLIASVVRDAFARLWDHHEPVPTSSTTEELIASGESQRLEFKSTARFNMHTQVADRKLEQVVVKTVTGFLNSEGGTLVIGVADDGSVVGLEPDFGTLQPKGDRDGFELFLRQRLESSLSTSTAATVSTRFDSLQGKDVCIVSVAASGRPVFAKSMDGQGQAAEFWVRIGNATRQLHGEEMVAYQADHWG